MHERGRYIANPLRIFEKILSFVVIPASGILIPLLFEVFEGRPFREQAGLYITTVALSYLVWFGCRQMFITLRFSESFNLTYPDFFEIPKNRAVKACYLLDLMDIILYFAPGVRPFHLRSNISIGINIH